MKFMEQDTSHAHLKAVFYYCWPVMCTGISVKAKGLEFSAMNMSDNFFLSYLLSYFYFFLLLSLLFSKVFA